MARAIWSGSISFGLLNVPVRMYSAVARRSIALREIRESDSSRIKHRRVAEGNAMTGIARTFGGQTGASFPTVGGWCCRARSAAAP